MTADYSWIQKPGSAYFLTKEEAAGFATAAQGALGASAYQKPAGGVPASDLDPTTQAELSKVAGAEVVANKVPIKLATTEDQYPTAMSVTEFVQEMMGNVTSSLQIPKPLDKESQLPATATPGAVFRITNMDITSPGSRGEAWGSDDSTWLKIVFQNTTIDNQSIKANGGIYFVSQPWVTAIVNSVLAVHNMASDAHAALFASKLHKLTGMVDGHLAVFAANELADSGKSPVDFATAAQGTKADSALQFETDPTVPSWAKKPQKPTYTLAELGAASAAQGTKADGAYQKPIGGIPRSDLAATVVGTTPVLSGRTFGGKPSYLLNVTVTLAASNDSDGAYYTIPTYKSLIDCRGHVLNKGSYTRMPIPMCNDNGYFCHIRIDGGGQIWIRAKEANGAFNGSDCMLNIEYLQS